MMRRVNRRAAAALLALSCLLPQAALALHHHGEAAEDCAGCGQSPAFECDGADCGSREHHHHERAHDPAACQACSAACAVALLETPAFDVALASAGFDAPDAAAPAAVPSDLWHSGRGPPA
jgi:hypothetical protein